MALWDPFWLSLGTQRVVPVVPAVVRHAPEPLAAPVDVAVERVDVVGVEFRPWTPEA